jgi:hypothetical protein
MGKPAFLCTLNCSSSAWSTLPKSHFLIFLFVVRLFSSSDKIAYLFFHKAETVDGDKLNFFCILQHFFPPRSNSRIISTFSRIDISFYLRTCYSLKGIISADWFVMNHCQQSFLLYLSGGGERKKCLRTQESITYQRRIADQVRSIYPWSVFVINVKFLYLNARKLNLEIAFLRCSRDFVTSMNVITEFDYMFSSNYNCMSLKNLAWWRKTKKIFEFSVKKTV